MTAALIASLVLFQAPVAEDPVLRKDRELNCAEWARTANLYLRLGEEKAVAQLLDRSGPKPTRYAIRPNHACHILRLLFQPKKGETLRRPLLGAWGDSPSDKNWPEFPFAIHSGVIFMFVEDYALAGSAETPEMYAKYLKENGVFRTEGYTVPTGKQAGQALGLFVRSKKWIADFGTSKTMERHLRRQTNYMP